MNNDPDTAHPDPEFWKQIGQIEARLESKLSEKTPMLPPMSQESTKNLADGMGSMKELFTSAGLFAALDKFGQVADVKVMDPAIALLVSQLSQETIETRTKLMQDLMTAVESPAVASAIGVFSGFVNMIITAADKFVTTFNAFQSLTGAATTLDGDTNTLMKSINKLNENVEYLDKAVDKWLGGVFRGFDDLQTMLANLNKVTMTQQQAQDQLQGPSGPVTILPIDPPATGFENVK